MNFLKPKTRITIGLVSLMLSVMLSVTLMDFGPNEKKYALEGRSKLCESIAISSSIYLTNNDTRRIKALLDTIVQRDDEILSACVRRADGRVEFEVGEHVQHWEAEPEKSTETNVQVPLRVGEQKWGAVEIRFKPVYGTSFSERLAHPWSKFFLAVGAIAFFVFSFYFGFVLKQLDPSKAVPKRVRAALDSLAEGLLVTDKKGRVVLANESFAGWSGRDPNKLIGRSASSFPWVFNDKAAGKFEFPWQRAIEQEQVQARVYLQLEDHNKKKIDLVANSSPVLGADGEYRGVLTSFEDVTELEQHKVELSLAKNAADDANRAKSEFLAHMSHEIRTPMNAIIGYTEVLRRGYDDSEEKRQQHLSTIQSSSEHLLALINDILDLSKIESGQMEIEVAPCSLTEIFGSVVSVMKIKAAENSIYLDFESETEIPVSIMSDQVRIRQTLINLVGNAIKFTREGGVRITARMIGVNGSPMLQIDVADTGIGMSEKALNGIFDPFSQADASITRRFGGTGLGLSISKQLVEKLGGEITVTSQLDHGSVFSITIDPGDLTNVEMRRLTLDDCISSTEAKKQPSTSYKLPRSRVLVVDDSETNRELASLLIRRAGAEVDQAENGKIAIEKANTGEFDAILMDVQMPVMDGLTATRKLREQGFTIPIIALTANVMQEDVRECHEAGCSGFLPKPIKVDLLLQTLCEVLGGEQLEADPACQTQQPDEESIPDQPLLDQTQKTNEAPLSSSPANHGPAIESDLPLDDEDFLMIVETFVANFNTKLGCFASALHDGKLDELADLAHWLKGSGGTAGFHGFTETARELQNAAARGDHNQCQELLRQVLQMASRIEINGNVGITLSDDSLMIADASAATSATNQPRCEPDSVSCEVEILEPLESTLPIDEYPEFRKVVETFAKRIRERKPEFDALYELRDATSLRDLAHWLKGSGGTAGFHEFTEPAGQLQNAAESSDWPRCESLIAEIHSLEQRIDFDIESSQNTREVIELEIPDGDSIDLSPAVSEVQSNPEPFNHHVSDEKIEGDVYAEVKDLQSIAAPEKITTSLPIHDERYRQVAETFVRLFQKILPTFRTAFDSRQFDLLGNLAERLSSSSAAAGFADFCEPANRLCMSAKSGETQQCERWLIEIESMAGRIDIPASQDRQVASP